MQQASTSQSPSQLPAAQAVAGGSLITSQQYAELSLEYHRVVEEQRQVARVAYEFNRADLPLLAESYVIEASQLAARMFELHDLLQAYEKARKQ